MSLAWSNPSANSGVTNSVKSGGGRERALGNKEYSGYIAGINSLIVGNYLTTPGKSVDQEICNLKIAGYEVVRIR